MEFNERQYEAFQAIENKSDEATVLRVIEMRQGEVAARIRQAIETDQPIIDEFKDTKMKISSFVLKLLRE